MLLFQGVVRRAPVRGLMEGDPAGPGDLEKLTAREEGGMLKAAGNASLASVGSKRV